MIKDSDTNDVDRIIHLKESWSKDIKEYFETYQKSKWNENELEDAEVKTKDTKQIKEEKTND